MPNGTNQIDNNFQISVKNNFRNSKRFKHKNKFECVKKLDILRQYWDTSSYNIIIYLN